MNRNNKWPESEIASELLKIAGEGMVMPSHSTLKEINRGDLENAINRTGGTKYWASKLNLKHKLFGVDTGIHGEQEVLEIIRSKSFLAEPAIQYTCPYDILVEGVLRVDVKTAHFTTYRSTDHDVGGWFYRIGKAIPADVIILYQKDDKDCYVIPWWECPITNMTISRSGGKYKHFKNDWSMLRRMVDHRLIERDGIPS